MTPRARSRGVRRRRPPTALRAGLVAACVVLPLASGTAGSATAADLPSGAPHASPTQAGAPDPGTLDGETPGWLWLVSLGGVASAVGAYALTHRRRGEDDRSTGEPPDDDRPPGGTPED